MYNEQTAKQSDNIMDKWIQSFTQSLIQFFKAEMDGEDVFMTIILILYVQGELNAVLMSFQPTACTPSCLDWSSLWTCLPTGMSEPTDAD